METTTMEWITENWSVVAGGIVAFLATVKMFLSAIKGAVNPIINAIKDKIKGDVETINSTNEQYNEDAKQRDIKDRICKWKVQLPYLTGDELEIAKQQIKDLENEL